MEYWLQQFIEFLPDGSSYLLILFMVAFAESLPMIGLIVPGSTLIVFAGFFVLHGKCSFTLLVIVMTGGALSGDLFSFWLGFYYGTRLLKFRSFQKHHKLVTRAEHFFVEHGGKSIFFARFLGPIRGITPFIAGLSGMPGRPFCGYALISAILWGICYPGLGYLGGSSWQNAQSLSAKFGLVILLILVAFILHYWIRRNFKRK
ncbi:MAG: DedA family protein [Desulfuromusa sp.]|jgi:membrane protein DedA with SNARE-associated domain|nr:DedA family protein [Desulfuromusa sp.]